jgi:hypothetical protein
MAALPDVAQVVRIQLRHTLESDTDVLPRFYLNYAGSAPTDAQLNTFCTSIATAWNSDLSPFHGSEVTLTEVLAVDLSTATSAVGAAGVSHAGSRSGGPLPAGTAALLNFAISRRYRGGRPKMFMPAFTVTDILNAQSWATTAPGNLLTAWNSFMTAVLAAGWSGAGTLTQVNVSYYEGFTVYNPGGGKRAKNVPTPRATPVVDLIIATSVSIRPASQRRRLGKTP